jgi:hypothetical protein
MRNRVQPAARANGRAAYQCVADAPLAPVSDGAPLDPVSDGGAPPDAARTAAGRFAKGNKCGLGNPFSRRLGKLRSAFLDAVTDEDVAAVARRLHHLAMMGDVQAAQVYLSYAVGKPRPAVEPDRLDLDEVALWREAPDYSDMHSLHSDRFAPALATEMAGRAAPATQGEYVNWLKARMEALEEMKNEAELDPFGFGSSFAPNVGRGRRGGQGTRRGG